MHLHEFELALKAMEGMIVRIEKSRNAYIEWVKDNSNSLISTDINSAIKAYGHAIDIIKSCEHEYFDNINKQITEQSKRSKKCTII